MHCTFIRDLKSYMDSGSTSVSQVWGVSHLIRSHSPKTKYVVQMECGPDLETLLIKKKLTPTKPICNICLTFHKSSLKSWGGTVHYNFSNKHLCIVIFPLLWQKYSECWKKNTSSSERHANLKIELEMVLIDIANSQWAIYIEVYCLKKKVFC
jgi:hypothetical protein